MSSTIVVRDINLDDKAWIKQEAARRGLSMEEFVRRLIHEKRKHSEGHIKLSETFQQYFGPKHGVELLLSKRYGYRSAAIPNENEV